MFGEAIPKLMNVCEFPDDSKWALLFRASRDGYKAENFHQKCDHHPNTLVLISTYNMDYNQAIGGFSTASWESSEQYKADKMPLYLRLSKIFKSEFNFLYKMLV